MIAAGHDRRACVARGLLVGLALLVPLACSERRASDGDAGGAGRSEAAPSSPAEITAGPIRFVDVTAATGVAFRRDRGFDGESFRVVETVNGGVALLDADGDGHLDIYLTNGRRADGGGDARNALWRARGDGTFEDVSARSGADDRAMSLGCAVADVDGDGRPDLYVTNDGPNRLFLNRGGGRFEDVASAAGVASSSMDAGSAFVDIDGDGDLDLYVASYVVDDGSRARPALQRGVESYWPPLNYPAAPDHLYENRGDGTFVDVSEASGIRAVAPGRGLGVIAGDIDGDGDQDLYVANDMSENHLFLNAGEGRFEELGFESGVAFGPEGEALGSMGIALGDWNLDGRIDLFVTNYQDQLNNLYVGIEGSYWEDAVHRTGTSPRSSLDVSWGVSFQDFDRDGYPDLFVANGHLNPYTGRMADSTSYEQTDRVWRNLEGERFEDVTDTSGDLGATARVSRGAAFGDIDDDGDVDIVVVSSDGAPRILRNETATTGAWCRVVLEGQGLNRDAIGATVVVEAGGRRQMAVRGSVASYLSADDPRLLFGLGAVDRIDRVTVRWPDGAVSTAEGLPVRRDLVARRADGTITVASDGGSRGG